MRSFCGQWLTISKAVLNPEMEGGDLNVSKRVKACYHRFRSFLCVLGVGRDLSRRLHAAHVVDC